MKSAKKSSAKKTKTKSKTKSKRPISKKAAKVKRPATKGTDNVHARVGVFGGSFDPFHNGHLNSMLTVAKALKLNRIRVVPANVSPLRKPVQGSTPEQRLAMVQRGVSTYPGILIVDEIELQREGPSFTIDTLGDFRRRSPREQLFLIIGMDQFDVFDQWKEFQHIIGMCDIVVTSRPGVELPTSLEAFPGGLKPLVKKFGKKTTEFNTGRQLHFVQLKDVEVSATEIRRRIREEQNVEDLVPQTVADYIRENDLYENVAKSIGDYERFTRLCADMLNGKGAINIQAFDLRKLSAPSEFTLVVSGTSTRHTSALAETLTREVKKQMGIWPQGSEGLVEGRWVVLDYGSLIIHIFYDFVRQEYRLEQLWKNASPLVLNLKSAPVAKPAADEKSQTPL